MDAAESEPREQPLLELSHAAKSFGAVQALVDGSVTLRGGEVHALLGENGAGKSTLVKILAGVHQPDAGTLTVNGREVTLHGPAAAQAAGIAVIYQEPTLFPDLTVAENMLIGRQPVKSGRRIDRRAMQDEAAAVFQRLGVPLDPGRVARGLSIADQQVVEIGKALSVNANVIVMGEPTAALSAADKPARRRRQRQAALDVMAGTDVNDEPDAFCPYLKVSPGRARTRQKGSGSSWQAEMSGFFVADGPPDQSNAASKRFFTSIRR